MSEISLDELLMKNTKVLLLDPLLFPEMEMFPVSSPIKLNLNEMLHVRTTDENKRQTLILSNLII